MLHPILGCDSGNINCIVLQALSWVQWAVRWSTSAVTALGLQLLQVPLQHLGIVTADNAAHVGHTLVRDFGSISVEELSKGIPIINYFIL